MIDDAEVGTDTNATEDTAPAATNESADWSEARTEEGTGIALDGHGLPINHRLRAERLASDGKTSDPAGTVTDQHIAETKERLDAEREAHPPVRASMRTAELEKIAADENVDLSTASNNAERVTLIEAARGEVA